MKETKYKKLFKNIGLITIGNFSSKILVFLLIPIYTNTLTTSEYGIADIIFTTVSLLWPVFSLLMSEAIMRFALDNQDNRQVFSSAIYLTTAGTLILFVLSPILLLFDEFKNYYLFFLVYYFFEIFNLLFLQFSKGINRVKNYVVASILSTISTIIFNIFFLVIIGWGLRGYLLAYILGQIISFVYLLISCKLWKYLINPKKIDSKVTKSMLLFAIPMIPNSISWWISNSSDKYMMNYFSGLAETGIYSISYKIPSVVTILSNIFIGAWQISAVDNFGSVESKKFYSIIYDNYVSILVVLISFLILIVKLMANFLFANDFYIAWQCSCILLMATMFNSLAAFLGTIYTSAKKTKFLFHSTLVGAVLNIIINFFLIQKYGGIGAAIATLLSYFVVWLMRIINSKNVLSLSLNYKLHIISFVLLIVQIYVRIKEYNYSNIISLILFIILFLLNFNTLKSFMKIKLISKKNKIV